MTIAILVHGEWILEEGRLVWWAESPEVPGFSASAETLVELRELITEALREIWSDRGDDPDGLELRYEMVPPAPVSLGAPVERQAEEADSAGPSVVEQVAAVAVA